MTVALLIALLATPVAAQRPGAGAPACQNPGAETVAAKPARPGLHRLDQEPPAKQVLTVMRSVDGCVKPVVVREDVSPAPRR